MASTSVTPSLGNPAALASYPSGSNAASSPPTLSLGSAWRQAKTASLKREHDLLVVSHAQRGIEISQLSTTPPAPLASLALPVGSSVTSNAVSITRNAASSSSSATVRSRTTYFALRTTQSTFEVRAWNEGQIGRDGRAKGPEGQQPATSIYESPRAIVSLHALSSDLLLAVDDSSLLTCLQRIDASSEATWTPQGTGLKIDGLIHNVSVARRLALGSEATTVVTLSSVKAPAVASKGGKKGRKSAIEVIDASEGSAVSQPAGALICSVLGVGSEATEIVAQVHVSKDIVADAGQVAAIDVDDQGSILILTRDGKLHEIEPVISGSPHLRSISSLFLPRLSTLPVALLRSSADYAHIVMAAKKDPESASSSSIAHLLAVDIRLGSVVATQHFKLPSSLGLQTSEGNAAPLSALHLSIADVPCKQTSSRLVISSCGAQAAATYVAEHTTPDASSLSFAVGDVTAKLSRAWIGEGSLHASPEESALASLSEAERQIAGKLREIRAKQGATEQAFAQVDEAFTAWTDAEQQRLRRQQEMEREAEAKTKAVVDSDNSEGEDAPDAAATAAAAAATQSQVRWSKPVRVHLSTAFCSALLPLLFDSPGVAHKTTPLHASKSVHYLLDRRVLSETIWDQVCERQQESRTDSPQSLVMRLAASGEWSTAMLALRYLPDVRERDAVALLALVSRPKQSSGVSLPQYLSALVSVRCSRPALRRALKDGLGSVDAVVRILHILEGWLKDRAQEGAALGISGNGKNAKGGGPASQVGKVGTSRRKRMGRGGQVDANVKVPRLEHLLSMISDLLDVFYPILLVTPSSHAIVHRLSRTMASHLGHLVDLRALVGPLASYARLDADRRAERAFGGGAPAAATAPAGKDANAAQAITGGGKVGAAQKNRRMLELEQSALAGPYVVEELEL